MFQPLGFKMIIRSVDLEVVLDKHIGELIWWCRVMMLILQVKK